MNEIIFIIHIFVIIACVLGALKLGKEALCALIVVLAILSNLFVTKQIILFGLQATPTDALIVGLVLSLNLLQEYYGQEITKKAIWISFAGSLVFVILSQIHLWYIPSSFDTTQIHALSLLSMMPRIIAASLFTYLIVQRIDCFTYGFLKKKFDGNYLVLRNYGAILFSQLIDTVLFSFLGLYGIIESIVPVMVISYCIKVIVVLIATPFLWFSRKIMSDKKL
jgi:queuosine precursor transporter